MISIQDIEFFSIFFLLFGIEENLVHIHTMTCTYVFMPLVVLKHLHCENVFRIFFIRIVVEVFMKNIVKNESFVVLYEFRDVRKKVRIK